MQHKEKSFSFLFFVVLLFGPAPALCFLDVCGFFVLFISNAVQHIYVSLLLMTLVHLIHNSQYKEVMA